MQNCTARGRASACGLRATAGLLVRRPPRVELESRLGCGSGTHADVPGRNRLAVSAFGQTGHGADIAE